MAYTEFYVTKGSSAADTNGGGPSLGTNDAPVYTSTNVDSDGAGTTLTDNSGSNWSGITIGDWLCFDTAGTRNFARIVTNPTASTVTVTPAVALSATGKTVNVGGAWATVDHAASTVTTSFVNAAGDPPRVNVKYNATAYNEYVVVDNSGTTSLPITFEGYETTAGDNCPNGNLPLVGIHGGSAKTGNGVFEGSTSYITVRNFYLDTNVNGDRAMFISGSRWIIENVRGKVTGTAAQGFINTGHQMRYINCWAEASSDSGFQDNGTFGMTVFRNCVSTNSGSYGFKSNSANTRTIYENCIADTPADDGFYLTATGSVVTNCVTYGSTGGSGIRLDDATSDDSTVIQNCIFDSNNQYGVEVDAAGRGIVSYCAFRNNTQGEINDGDGNINTGSTTTYDLIVQGPGNVTLSSSPFTDAANGDFSLNNTASAGAACRSAGFPGAMLDGTNVGYIDIGALRHADPAGGGGGLLVNPGLTGGLGA